MSKAQAKGQCDLRFEKLQQEFERRLASGEEFGGSLAVIKDGEFVVDLWGGAANADGSKHWESDTIVNAWSLTKLMTAICALVLVERGDLDVNAPVAQYWPEFAENGKDNVLVKHLLSHSSGLAAWEEPIDIVEACDLPYSTDLLAKQAPWWEPGSAPGYHLLSFGHLVGEVIQRISGKSVKQFFREELAEPLGADFHIGVPLPELGRVADVLFAPPPPLPPEDSIAFKAFTSPMLIPPFVNNNTWRTTGVAGAGGHGNARSIAQVQALMSHGGELNGVRLLSQETIDLAMQSVVKGKDQVMGWDLDFGLGYGLSESGLVPFLPARRMAFWGGAGGSLVINDPENRSTFVYVMNKMEPGAMLGNPNSIAYYTLFNELQTPAS
jgi:CubicO group peptidase (beta-lactamase class C family)